jgi:hypothetical protein
MIPTNLDTHANLLASSKSLIEAHAELLQGAAITGPAQFVKPIVAELQTGFLDMVKRNPGIFTQKPEFESSYKGLVDGINDLSKQIDAKKAELEKPDLDPSARMQLSIEMQELMQMRLQMITITTNLLKTDHDSAQAVNNNLRA